MNQYTTFMFICIPDSAWGLQKLIGSFMFTSAPAIKGSLPPIKGHLTKACAGAVLKHVLPVKTSEQTWLTFSEEDTVIIHL